MASATNLNATTGCGGTTKVLDIGTVLPGTIGASTDCALTFGSSNDSSMLRIGQADAWNGPVGQPNTAMGSEAFASEATGAGNILNGAVATSGGAMWVVGNGGVVRHTSDGGATWTSRNTAAVNLRDIAYVSGTAGNETMVAVGSAGSVYRTTNGGTTWTAATTPPPVAANLLDVSMLPSGVGWVIGQSGASTGYLYKTTNGGDTWVDQTSAGCAIANHLHAVVAVNDTNAWAIGQANITCRTTDGTTWAAPANKAFAGARSIIAFDANNIWVTGTTDRVARTTDGGATAWTTWTVGTGEDLNALFATTDQRIYVAGNDDAIAVTANGGTSWRTLQRADGNTSQLNALAGSGTTVMAVGFLGASARAFLSPATTVPNYLDDGTADWDTVGSTIAAFGACLKSVGGGATNQWNLGATCPTTDGNYWNAVPASTAKVAYATGSGSSYTATLRFAFRPAAAQAPGIYLAPVLFEVLGPNVP